jgi:hypothetical protein
MCPGWLAASRLFGSVRCILLLRWISDRHYGTTIDGCIGASRPVLLPHHRMPRIARAFSRVPSDDLIRLCTSTCDRHDPHHAAPWGARTVYMLVHSLIQRALSACAICLAAALPLRYSASLSSTLPLTLALFPTLPTMSHSCWDITTQGDGGPLRVMRAYGRANQFVFANFARQLDSLSRGQHSIGQHIVEA